MISITVTSLLTLLEILSDLTSTVKCHQQVLPIHTMKPDRNVSSILQIRNDSNYQTDEQFQVNPDESNSTILQTTTHNKNSINDHITPDHNAGSSTLSSALSIVLSKAWSWLTKDLHETGDGRTFGKIRRMQMALVPLIFKFGILYAMVGLLVVMGAKILILLKMLLLFNGAVILGKLFALKMPPSSYVEHSLSVPQYAWPNGPTWPQMPPGKEIHLHLHGGQLIQPTGYGHGPATTHTWSERKFQPYYDYQ